MKDRPDASAGRIAGLLAAMVTCTCLAASGCGGAAASTPGGASHPPATSSSSSPIAGAPAAGSAPVTGNLCADAAALNGTIRTMTEALVMHPGSGQQSGKLLGKVAAAYTGLGSEAPGQLKGAFAKIAGFYRAVQSRLARSGGQLTLADIEPAASPGVAPAIHQISSYFATHCRA